MSTPQPHRVTVIPGDGVGPEVVRSAVRIIDAAGRPDRLGGGRGRRRGLQAGRHERRPAGDTRIDRADRRRPEGPARDAGRVRREERQRHPAQALRDVRQRPSGPRAARRPDPLRGRGRRHDHRPRERRGPVRRASSTCSPPTSASASRSSAGRARRRSSATPSSSPAGRVGAKVTCATKANIMKLTEGLFKARLRGARPEYPEIAAEHLIIDNVAHQFAKDPAQFDIVVTTNLNGDIISDLASGLVGGLGFASSGNYGDRVAIFEAVHGSAPKYAGKDVINPTALILSSVMMLRHLGELPSRRPDRERRPANARAGPGDDPGPGPPGRRRRRHGHVDDRLHRRRDRQPRQTARAPGAAPVAPARPAHPRPRCRRGRTAPIGTPGSTSERSASTSSSPRRSRPMSSGPSSSAWPAVPTASSSSRAGARRSTRRSASAPIRSGCSAPGSSTVGGRDAVDAELLDLQARVAARHPGWTHVEKLHVFDGVEAFTRAQGQ